MPQPGAEGAYLIVNKNLIEMVALLAILAFRTGTIAGLDRVVLAKRAAGIPDVESRAGQGQPAGPTR
jgi:hypothetical protein